MTAAAAAVTTVAATSVVVIVAVVGSRPHVVRIACGSGATSGSISSSARVSLAVSSGTLHAITNRPVFKDPFKGALVAARCRRRPTADRGRRRTIAGHSISSLKGLSRECRTSAAIHTVAFIGQSANSMQQPLGAFETSALQHWTVEGLKGGGCDTYCVHAQIVADAILPTTPLIDSLAGVVAEPLIDVLQRHGIVRSAHECLVDQLRIWLIIFGAVWRSESDSASLNNLFAISLQLAILLSQ